MNELVNDGKTNYLQGGAGNNKKQYFEFLFFPIYVKGKFYMGI